MRTPFQMVREFHDRFGIPNKDRPEQPSIERLELRVRLHIEEFCELLAELLPSERGRAWVEGMRVELMEDFYIYTTNPTVIPLDLAAVAKELADLDMVGTGTAAEFGIPHDRVVQEVHASNMRKVQGILVGEGYGKAIKPEGWRPPDIAAVLGPVAPEPRMAPLCQCWNEGVHREDCPLHADEKP